MSLRNRYVYIMPESSFSLGWNLVLICLVLLQAVTIPIDAAFETETLGWGEWVISAFFVMVRDAGRETSKARSPPTHAAPGCVAGHLRELLESVRRR